MQTSSAFSDDLDARRATAATTTLAVRARSHHGRTLGAILVVLAVGLCGWSVSTNPNFQWGVVGQYLFAPDILQGLRTTIILTVLSMAMGTVLGGVIALMRLSRNRILALVGSGFVWIFRGTPMLVQIIFFYYLSALYPTLVLGIPNTDLHLFEVQSNTVITPFVAAVAALTLNEAAYMSEIVRAGILAVDRGQAEAAQALGMTRSLTVRRIVLPQAMRVIIPPTGNEVINMLKATALVSTIALTELLYSAQLIYSRTLETIPLLMVATLWYLVMTSILSIGQYYLERRFSRGHGTGSATGSGLLNAIRQQLSFRRRTTGGAHE